MSPSPQKHREKTSPFQAMVRIGSEPDPAPLGSFQCSHRGEEADWCSIQRRELSFLMACCDHTLALLPSLRLAEGGCTPLPILSINASVLQ